ncbi:MAG TPA: hypothetical protein VK203_26285 [Nostocaceae cyanobacterium]|nr:hypothetical protein [Nostocaceae cyanobacterium]
MRPAIFCQDSYTTKLILVIVPNDQKGGVEVGRWGDGVIGRWGDGEMGRKE